MWISFREGLTIIHGMGFGATFLLLFAGVWVLAWGLRSGWLTEAGLEVHRRWVSLGAGLMALVSWLTVILGTYLPYTWYRAKPPQGADLSEFPRSFILANPKLAFLHNFGMEWKEHIAWLCPILATAAAYIIWRYGAKLAVEHKLRQSALTLLTVAFAAAAVAGLLGAFITKAAPIH
ncbi:MAG: hypothetical protein HQK55_08880 [Deltaproteobacteria bacterium]|nr:hypothetical protein [Deltaproteobacteria bacterium]